MNKFSFRNLKTFFHKYESSLSALTLVLGFIFDFFTLDRVDYIWDNIFIIFYLLVVGASMLLMNLYEEGRLRDTFIKYVYEFLPFTLQFAFGGLFSAFTIFYSKSASFISSGLVVLILFLLLVGNEFFKKRYEKLVFQVSLYFIALFTFSIYFWPVLIKQMGTIIFLGSGAISLGLVSLFILFIAEFAPRRYVESYRNLLLAIFGIYISINFLYFTNIIPPIPLSLTLGDVYHKVERRPDGNYLSIGEPNSWQEKFNFKQKVHLTPGAPLYVFSSVFAPAGININVIHDWQYYDSLEDEWKSVNRITFPIVGGRREGYRGFSRKDLVFPGEWRVDIKTERGQVIGRIRFDVEVGTAPEKLETKIL